MQHVTEMSLKVRTSISTHVAPSGDIWSRLKENPNQPSIYPHQLSAFGYVFPGKCFANSRTASTEERRDDVGR